MAVHLTLAVHGPDTGDADCISGQSGPFAWSLGNPVERPIERIPMEIAKVVWCDGGMIVYRTDWKRLFIPLTKSRRMDLTEAAAIGSSGLSKIAGQRWKS